MLSPDPSRTLLELPVEERLELARRLIESLAWPAELNPACAEGIRRIEEIACGQIEGLTEEQFRDVLK